MTDRIRDYATSLYRFWCPRDGVFPITDLVRSYGGEFSASDSIDAVSTIVINRSGSFTIFLNTVTEQPYQRYEAAVEMGHYLLHYGHHGENQSSASFSRYPRCESEYALEQEAEEFADNLLAPLPVCRVLATITNPVWNIGAYLDIPSEIAKKRYEEITASQNM